MNKEKFAIFGIIPARFASRRFPGKPLAFIGKKSLIQRTYENTQRAGILHELFVATDSQKIATHVQEFGGTALLTSEQCVNGTERLVDALHRYDFLRKAKIIVNIQGDHPCIEPKTINTVVDLLKNDETASLATAVSQLENFEDYHSSDVVKCVFTLHGNALYFSRCPIPYSDSRKIPQNCYVHHGIYAYRTKFLLEDYPKLQQGFLRDQEKLEQLQFLENGYQIKVACVEEKVMGVDTLHDLEKIENYLCQ